MLPPRVMMVSVKVMWKGTLQRGFMQNRRLQRQKACLIVFTSADWPSSFIRFLFSFTDCVICVRISEKSPLHVETEFLFLITHNFKAIIAMDLKPGITILQSLHCTRCKFCAPPTSGLDMAIASIIRCQKSAILCLPLVPHHFR